MLKTIHFFKASKNAKAIAPFLLACMIMISGCGLNDVSKQIHVVDQTSSISGTIEPTTSLNTPVYVQLHKKNKFNINITSQQRLSNNQTYKFYTAAGQYLIFAFYDENNDQKFSAGEKGSYLSRDKVWPFEITLTNKQEVQLPPLAIGANYFFTTTLTPIEKLTKTAANLGKVITLDDPIFDEKNAKLGFWRPMDFLQQIGGGIFMLEPYDPAKTPILFIHGANGSPQQFKSLISSIDQKHFQIWVAYYPSGIRLEMISNAIRAALDQLETKYNFKKLNLISYSMGGLVSRSFLLKHQESNASYIIDKYMTINSPMAGLNSARNSLTFSPLVLPAWRDLASDSDFIKKINAWNLPRGINYHLVFSYQPGMDGDGVVPLNSQLSWSLQEEADNIIAIESDHTAVLENPDFIKYFANFLNTP